MTNSHMDTLALPPPISLTRTSGYHLLPSLNDPQALGESTDWKIMPAQPRQMGIPYVCSGVGAFPPNIPTSLYPV